MNNSIIVSQLKNILKTPPATPAIIISDDVTKREKDPIPSPDCRRRIPQSSRLSTSPANYDESLKLLSKSLEQICRRGSDSNSSLNSLSIKDGPPRSPLVTAARPQSFHMALVKNNSTQLNQVKKDLTGGLLIKIRHEETQKKLQQNLSKICASANSSPMTGVIKRISDAQENLRSKFRPRVEIGDRVENLTDLFITIDSERNLNVNYLKSNKPGVLSNKETAHKVPKKFLPGITVLHTCKVPEGIKLEKILCSVHEGPSLYIRPSNSSSIGLVNTDFKQVPIVHTDEKSLKFTITLQLPQEILPETTEVTRIDENLIVKAGGSVGLSSNKPSSTESSLRFQMELPEDSDGRSLIAKVNENRVIIIEGNLMPASRRMTCKF